MPEAKKISRLAVIEQEIKMAWVRVDELRKNNEYYLADALEKGLRDLITSMDEARKEGFKEGFKRAFEECKEKGKKRVQIEATQKMLALNMDFRTISTATGLSLSQIQELAKKQ